MSLGVFSVGNDISEGQDDIVSEALDQLGMRTNSKMVVINGYELPSSVSDHVLQPSLLL